MPLVRLFKEGTHKGLTYTGDHIKSIYDNTLAKGKALLPFVLGHPKNDLPVLGFLPNEQIKLYEEEGKQTIGFERENAEFSEESIAALKHMGKNKISIRLRESIIAHIGLVDSPAVKDNANQDFADNMNGDFSAVDDFAEDKEENFFNKLENRIENYFKTLLKTHKKEDIMNQTNQDFSVENTQLKAEVEKNKQEIERLKKENADFVAQKQASNKAMLTAKIKELKMDETEAKETQDFGEKLLAKDEALFTDWLGKLAPKQATVQVINGSVANGDFSDPNKKATAEEELKKQFSQVKKQ